MKNIIFVTATMGGGGSERVIAALSDQFIKLGHNVTILMTSKGDIAYSLNSKVTVRQISKQSGGNPLKRLKRVNRLRREFLKDRESYVISFGTETNLFCILAGLGTGIPIILSDRNNPEHCTYAWLRNIIYSMGKHFVFQTPDAKAYYSKKIQKKSMVIPNPLIGELPIRKVEECQKTVVAVGRLTPVKNHTMLIRAFNEFRKDHRDYKLIIYGDGELRQEMIELIKQLGLNGAVVLEGFQKGIHGQIKNAGMYVLSSDSEGMSNSLLEAMAIGLPVISTDCPIGGSRMCIENGVNGLLVPVGDTGAMAEAMAKIADQTTLAECMGREAQKVREKFSIELIASQWLEVGDKR